MAQNTELEREKTPSDLADRDLCNSLTDVQEAIVRDVISRATDKWSLWAMSELVTANRPLRFSQLLRQVEGVSQKSLTATLRHLERDGLVKRTVVVQVPIRVDYEATAMGHDFMHKFHPLWMWVAKHLPEVGKARRTFDRNSKAK
jgi:DNA-binding HxlR family transcriptional regulator